MEGALVRFGLEVPSIVGEQPIAQKTAVPASQAQLVNVQCPVFPSCEK